MGTLPDILGLVWPFFRPKPGSTPKIPGRILQIVWGPFSSAELIFVDLCSVFHAVAVGNGPGPNCGRKTIETRPRQKIKVFATLPNYRLVTHFNFFIVGPDKIMDTKRPYNWSPGLILGAFCTSFRARPD